MLSLTPSGAVVGYPSGYSRNFRPQTWVVASPFSLLLRGRRIQILYYHFYIVKSDGAVGYHSDMKHIFEVFLWRLTHHGQFKPCLIGAIVLFLGESLPALQNGADEDHVAVGVIVEM